ncbi:MAG: penicillin-binding protein 2 [Pseudomonadota bacterium]|jgi:penicillin-binding protein 2
MEDFDRYGSSVNASQDFIQRITLIVVIIIFLSLLLVARLVYLQVAGFDHYETLSQENRVKIAPLPPVRGIIYDRHGEVLADNVPTYSLEITPERVVDLEDTLSRLQSLLGLSDDDIARFRNQRSRHKSFESVPVKLQLSEDEIAAFSVRMPFFPGVEIRARMIRVYPYGDLLGHVVGYVGRISESDMATLDPDAYSGTYHIGKSGLEKNYEALLHGVAGYEEMETNVQGRAVQVLGTTPPLAGSDLYLSLDVRLQRIAMDALGDWQGALVAMEPSSGRILALASKPAFDPNPFVYGISHKAYDALQNAPGRPLYNRAVRGLYPPGSTVKPFVSLAGLEVLGLGSEHTVFCPGYYQLPGSEHKYRDWRKGGHGTVNLGAALTQSCDVYYYDMAQRLGIDRLQSYMKRFGFGERTGVDMDGENRGLFPNQAWKMKQRKQAWYPGETLIAGIGQGYVQATPLQLARAVATLANRGRLVTPYLVDRAEGGDPALPHPAHDVSALPQIAIRPEHYRAVVDAMINVVHSQQGTAKGIAQGLEYRIAGKTGTAQVFTVGQNQDYKSMHIDEAMRDHAWFVAFAPADNPSIAVSVLIEHGGHGGSVAAPMARKVMDAYLGYTHAVP